MATHCIRARPARGPAGPVRFVTDSDVLAGVLEDAAHVPGGHAAAVVEPRSEADIATVLAQTPRVLPIGAQSSLTGGATPQGDVVLSLRRMAEILHVGETDVTMQPGVTIAALQEGLAGEGKWFPPAPTFDGASAGGVVATNAAGAATYKYGTTRHWVRRLTVVLAGGEVLDVTRGEVQAHPDGYIEIATAAGVGRVPVPSYRMPGVPKCSAGYFAAPGMDLIDLFIGSEGTLGIIAEITFAVQRLAVAPCLALIPVFSEAAAIELVAALRVVSHETWRSRDRRGIDVAAIEHVDRRSLDLLREDGIDRRSRIDVPAGTAVVLLAQLELPADLARASDEAYRQIADALAPEAPDTPLVRFSRLLGRFGVLEHTELALPAGARRRAELLAWREAVPAAVNQRISQAKHAVDTRIEKTAADMVVPFERFAQSLAVYRASFERRGLDYAIWGHISDGHVHPNVLPRTWWDVEAGRAAILESGRAVIALGGCPLAEHGVGRNPVKQALLRELYGEQGLEEMRRVRRALDPEGKLARGVIFKDP